MAAVVFLLLGAPCLGQETPVYYTPIVNVRTGAFVNENGGVVEAWWVSTLLGYSGGTTDATLGYVDAFGPGASISSDYGCPESWTFPPGVGFVFESRDGGCVRDPVGGPGFLAFTATEGMQVDSSVERIWYDISCDVLGRVPSSEGRRPLPIYRGLFPAGSNATSGAVSLGAPRLYCFGPEHRYPRRVNVTMFNGGEQPATFSVTVRRLELDPRVLVENRYSLGPKEVFQANDLAFPWIPGGESDLDLDQMVWITITADQPFLSYVTTVYDLGTPHDVGFEVYPSRLAQ
ncbi:hypothetical protein FBQ97_08940 [Acidobacteria bacterium ACD]|nr:hypothetical protein [Acidobacteria bacterium ACD]